MQQKYLVNEGNKQAIVARRIKNKKRQVMNAEKMLRDWLLENKLNVTEHEDERAWALLRLRADRSIAPGDLGAFKFKLVDSNMDKNLLQIEGYEDRL